MDLDRCMRQVLAELELLSNGTTTKRDPGGHSAPASRLLFADRDLSAYPHLWFRRRYENAWNDRGREAVYEEAITARDAGRGGERHQRRSLSWEQFVVRKYEGWSCARVAEAEKCHRMQVWRAREALGFHGKDGALKATARAA